MLEWYSMVIIYWYQWQCICKIKNTFFNFRKQNVTLRLVLIRLVIVTLVTIAALFFRLSLQNNQLPLFSKQDNPTSFSDSLLTRIMTYNYLLYFNAMLLTAPIILCYDWQMLSIPLIQNIMDHRNLGTVVFYMFLISLCMTVILSRNKVQFEGCNYLNWRTCVIVS